MDDPQGWDFGTPFKSELPFPPDRKSIVNVKRGKKEGLGWQEIPGDDDQLVDGVFAKTAIEWLGKREKEKPFFLAVGFHRPHLPLVAPAKYFDLYPFESITLPDAPADDEADIPEPARNGAVPGYALTATPEQLKTIRVIATGIAKDDSAALLPAPKVLREHYVRVTQSTPMAPLPPGDYPDALVPLDMPAQELNGTEVVNQPYWVDVFVPYTAAPGAYTGEVRFEFADGMKAIASYTLNVWDFDLPVVPKLRTSIMTTVRHVAQVHGLEYHDNAPSLAHAGLLNAYYDLLAEHRLSVDQIYGSYPDASTGKLDEDKVERALRKHLLHRHCNSIGLPIWPKWPFKDPLGEDRASAMSYVAQWMKLLAKIHCESRGYVIMGDLDEPNNEAAYATVRRWGEFFNEVEKKHGVRVPLHVTEQPTPDKAAWGSLVGAVDIWVPHFSEVWKDMEWAGGKHDIALRRQAGEEVWAYAALVQMPVAWEEQHGRPRQLTSRPR